jgi:hypothetical protein
LWEAPSILDDSPALELLRYLMSYKEGFRRRVSVGTVDSNTGEFKEFN